VLLAEPIKEVGTHEFALQLTRNVQPTVSVEVIAEGEPAEAQVETEAETKEVAEQTTAEANEAAEPGATGEEE